VQNQKNFRKEEDCIKTNSSKFAGGPGILSEFEGTVSGHRDGHGFVQRDDGDADLYLSPSEMRAVLHGDRVKARVIGHDKRGRPEGRVIEIIERPKQNIIGRLLQESGVWLMAPEDKRYGQDVLIPKSATGSAKMGQVVVVELTEPPSLYGQPVGRVIEVLGEIDDPGMEIEIAVRKYGVPHEFSNECLAEAKALPEKLRATDKKNRVDLSDVPLITIDGEDARDFDDAVYCEPAKVGRGKAANGWRLLVAIADVSHYVQGGSGIDKDAIERATSVYFPRRVIPMLPEKLSNGLCSLNPAVDRLCMVADMLISGEGEVHAYQFYPAVMHSQARMTYTEVAAILANTRGPEAIKRKKNGFDAVPHLLNLHDVFRALLKSRERRGAVDFETVETQIICDDAGRIERIEPRVRNDAHRLIEEAMLAANVCSADFIAQHKHTALFRVHEGPTPEKKEILRAYLRSAGVGMSISDDPTPGEFAQIALATKERPDAQQIHTMLLRSMQQAIYTPINSGHFGLAYEAYTHFTSPIRRYPDLLVHRVIKALLAGKKYHLSPEDWVGASVPKVGRPGRNNGKPAAQREVKPAPKLNAEQQAWQTAGGHCSANERRADEASRDVQAWLKCKYMREHLGEEYAGTVTAATSFGLFVTLDALYVEGLVHITELGGEYYRFDEARQELRGERTGIRYAIGTRVQVQVSRVDLDGRKIDFRLVQDPLREAVREATRGGPSGAAGSQGQRGDKPRSKALPGHIPAGSDAKARKTRAQTTALPSAKLRQSGRASSKNAATKGKAKSSGKRGKR
jgi:ribonuclease R